MSDPYTRRRRLALIIAGASALLLGVWLYSGHFPEFYSHPVPVRHRDLLFVVHRGVLLHQNDAVSYLMSVDPQTLQLRSRTLYYEPLACGDSPDALLGFFGTTWRPLPQDSKLEKLDQEWPVLAAARDGDDVWLYGVRERSIVARRLRDRAAGLPVQVAAAGADVERIVASGAVVAWKEKDRPDIRAFRRAGDHFEELPDFPTGDAAMWTVVQAGPRTLALYRRAGREWQWSTLALHIRCCASCGLPPPPERWTFADPFQLLARRVTGLGACAEGDRVRIVLARLTAIQFATVPLATLTPDPEAALVPVRLAPGWKRIMALLLPSVLVFFSVSLVYLGFVLVRERLRALRAGTSAASGPRGVPYAAALERVVAYVIDQMILTPAAFVAVDLAGLQAEGKDLSDPALLGIVATFWALGALYFTAQEAFGGQTIGKRIVGIRVVAAARGRAGPGRVAARNLLRLVDPYNVCLLVDLVLILVTRRRQRLGDLLAGTVVVQVDVVEAPK